MTDYVSDQSPGASGKAAGRLRPKLDAAATTAHDAYDSLKEVAATALGEAKARVSEASSQVSERVERRYGDLQAWVQLRPTQALGIAAGVGVVLGLLLRGNSTKTIYLRDRD
jgi:ElaB/YqjD/DUF883 family membrane-anchored ribosome-binding protein